MVNRLRFSGRVECPVSVHLLWRVNDRNGGAKLALVHDAADVRRHISIQRLRRPESVRLSFRAQCLIYSSLGVSKRRVKTMKSDKPPLKVEQIEAQFRAQYPTYQYHFVEFFTEGTVRGKIGLPLRGRAASRTG